MSRVLPGRISAGAAAEAVPDERAAGEAFTLEDGQRVFLRVAAVDGDRHVQLCSEPELGRKRRFLHVMRRAFRVGARVIQAYFPDGTVKHFIDPDDAVLLARDAESVIEYGRPVDVSRRIGGL